MLNHASLSLPKTAFERDQFVTEKNLAVPGDALRTPSEQREKIAERLGHDAHVLVRSDAGGAVALGEPRLVWAENERDVGKHRRRCAERVILQQLLGRVRNVVGAADDVRHAHVEIVSDDAEVICRDLVGAQQDEIFDLAVGELQVAEHCIVPAGRAVERNCEPHRRVRSHGFSRGRFLRRDGAATPVIHRRTTSSGGLGAARLQLLFRAEAVVRVTAGQQSLCSLLIQIHPPRLEERPLVPVQPNPAHAL